VVIHRNESGAAGQSGELNAPEDRGPARLARLAHAFDISGDGALLIDRETLCIVDANEAACRVFGCSLEELRTLQPNEITGCGETAADHAVILDDVIANAPRTTTTETISRKKDGESFASEVSWVAMCSGGRWIVVATIRDITERKNSQARLVQFRAALDQSPDGLVLVDRESMRTLDCNITAALRAGPTREEFLAAPIWERTVPSRSRMELESLYDEAIAMAPRIQTTPEHILKGPGGAVFPAEITRRAVQIDGRWVIVINSRDISERKRAEEELQHRLEDLARSNEELERFAYIASHDLTEPLRMVAGYTQLLERRCRDRLDGEALEFMDFIVGGTVRMKRLIDDLLAYSRVGRQVKHQPVRMDDVLDDVLSNLQQLIAEKSAAIERGPLPVVTADRTAMTQLLQNLVGNALKFQGAATSAVVRIAASQQESGWTFTVADNGIGIAPEDFERIFVIFQRLHARKEYGGTGIGLAICKKIVERHGGRIWLESQPGVGTKFYFTLPRKAPGQEGGDDLARSIGRT
jgi:PAS domain S-box-containing protein